MGSVLLHHLPAPQNTICRLLSFLCLIWRPLYILHRVIKESGSPPNAKKTASSCSLFLTIVCVSLPTPTDQLTVPQGGLTQFEEENCARLVWVKGVYLSPPRLTVYSFLVLDTAFQPVALTLYFGGTGTPAPP